MSGFRRSCSSVDNMVDMVTSVQEQKMQNNVTVAVFVFVKGAFDNIKRAAILRNDEAGIIWTTLCLSFQFPARLHNIHVNRRRDHLSHSTLWCPTMDWSEPCPLQYIAFERRQWCHRNNTNFVVCGQYLHFVHQRGHFERFVQGYKRQLNSFYDTFVPMAYNYPLWSQQPLPLLEKQLSDMEFCGWEQDFLREEAHVSGYSLNSSLIWAPHVQHLRRKLDGLVLKMFCDSRWGSTISSLLRLYNCLFIGLLRYSVLALNGMSHSNLKNLECVQAQASRISLGL